SCCSRGLGNNGRNWIDTGHGCRERWANVNRGGAVMDTSLVRSVARGLRYRPLGYLVGRAVEVAHLDRIEEAVRLALSPDLPDGCCLAWPEPRFREGAVAKYGILDLSFTAPGDMLASDISTGMPLLRELGYLPGGETGPQNRVC